MRNVLCNVEKFFTLRFSSVTDFNVTSVTSYRANTLRLLNQIIVDFDKINWLPSNPHLERFFHDLVALLACCLEYRNERNKWFWETLWERFVLVVSSKLRINLILASFELRVGLAKVVYLFFNKDVDCNNEIQSVWPRLLLTQIIQEDNQQKVFHRSCVFFLLIFVPTYRVGLNWENCKKIICTFQKRYPEKTLNQFIHFSSYFRLVSDDELKFHLLRVTDLFDKYVEQRLNENHDEDNDIQILLPLKYDEIILNTLDSPDRYFFCEKLGFYDTYNETTALCAGVIFKAIPRHDLMLIYFTEMIIRILAKESNLYTLDRLTREFSTFPHDITKSVLHALIEYIDFYLDNVLFMPFFTGKRKNIITWRDALLEPDNSSIRNFLRDKTFPNRWRYFLQFVRYLPIPLIHYLFFKSKDTMREMSFVEECVKYSFNMCNILPDLFAKMPCEVLHLIGVKLAENHEDPEKWCVKYRDTRKAVVCIFFRRK